MGGDSLSRCKDSVVKDLIKMNIVELCWENNLRNREVPDKFI